MATIKLGSLTLGNVAIGGSTIGDTRKLSKSNIFRAEAIKNHTEGKTVSKFISSNVVESTPTTTTTTTTNPNIGIGGNGGDIWMLSSGYWDDNGVWDDNSDWNA